MNPKDSLKETLANNNPASLIFDSTNHTFVSIPAQLCPHSEEVGCLLSPEVKVLPSVKLVPFLNKDQTFQSASPYELINTTGKNAKFISDTFFKSGVHFLELSCISDPKDVKLSLIKKSKKGLVKEYALKLSGLKVTDSALVKIDLDHGLFAVTAAADTKDSHLKIKGANFQFMIELASVGSFVSINPFYTPKGQNSVMTANAKLTESASLGFLKRWTFVRNVDEAKRAALQSVVTALKGEGGDGTEDQWEEIYERDSGILALKTPKTLRKPLRQKVAKEDLVSLPVAKSLFRMVLLNCPLDSHLQHTALTDFVSKHGQSFGHKKSPNKLHDLFRHFTGSPMARLDHSYSAKDSLVKVEYLSSTDSLLLFNGSTKLALFREKNLQGNFVVSPFAFDTQSVRCHLSKEEFSALFHSFRWPDLFNKLCLSEEEVLHLEAIFTKLTTAEHLLADDTHVHFRLSEAEVQLVVQKAFEYMHWVVSPPPAEPLPEESLHEPDNKDCKTETEKAPLDSLSDDGLRDFFNENQDKQSPSEHDHKTVKCSPDHSSPHPSCNFPNEFDVHLTGIFKLEEALHLQSKAYRSGQGCRNRGHTSFGRLFTFALSCLPLPQVVRLADFGIYVRSVFQSQFQHFKHQHFACSDFNDQNAAGVLADSYASTRHSPHPVLFPNDNVPLSHSLSHMPCFQSPVPLKQVLSIDEGKFVCLVADDLTLTLLSTQFGLTRVFQTSLDKELVWTVPRAFEDLIRNHSIETGEELKEPAEAVQPVEDKQAVEPLPEAVDPDKLIDKAMLDKLYSMGFSLEQSRKALTRVKSSSVDDAINEIFQMKNEGKEQSKEPRKAKSVLMQLKPEWVCKVCTLHNLVTADNQSPDVCDACGNSADQSAYFEETEEESLAVPQVEPDRASKSEARVMQSDVIDGAALTVVQHDNGLRGHFLVVSVRREDRQHLLTIRLALSESVVKRLAVQNSKTKLFANGLTGHSLRKGAVEEDIACSLNDFHMDKLLTLWPRMLDCDVLVETKRTLTEVGSELVVRQVVADNTSGAADRPNESRRVYLLGEDSVVVCQLVSTATSYCSNQFEVTVLEKVPVRDVLRVVVVNKHSVALLHPTQVTFYDEDLHKKLNSVVLQSFSVVLGLSAQRVTLATQTGEALTVPLDDHSLANTTHHLQHSIKALDSKSAEKEDGSFMNPQSVLDFFKRQSPIRLALCSSANLVVQHPTTSPQFRLSAQVANPNSASLLCLRPECRSGGFNLTLECFVRVNKPDDSVTAFAKSAPAESPRQSGLFSNNYPKLDLRTVLFNGQPMSRNHHVSQMLIDNGECFSTKTPFHPFVFESVFERVMKVRKVTFRVSDLFREHSLVDNVLVFVFNDLSLVHQMEALAHADPSTLDKEIRNACIPSSAEPCVTLSLKKAVNGVLSEELEVAQYGRFVAFMPIGRDLKAVKKHLDCLQFFGVEGEYAIENERELLQADHSVQDMTQTAPVDLDGFSVRVAHSGSDELVSHHSIVAVSERQRDFLVKTRVTVAVAELKSNDLTVELSAASDRVLPFALSASLTKISHPLVLKIKEQMKTGQSASLASIFKGYNEAIVGADFKEDKLAARNFQVLVDLLLLVVDLFAEKAIDPVLHLDFESMLVRLVLCCSDNKVRGPSRFLFEKLFCFPQSHSFFVELFLKVLARIATHCPTTHGLSAFWQLLTQLEKHASPSQKTDIVKATVDHLSSAIAKTRQLVSPEDRLLKSLGFPETVNCLADFSLPKDTKAEDDRVTERPESSPDTLSYNSQVDNSRLVSWNGFAVHEHNSAEFFINLTEVSRVTQVLVKFPKVGVLTKVFLDVHFFDPLTNCFEQVKSKLLPEDFLHMLSCKPRSDNMHTLDFYDLGFNFRCLDRLTKLIRVVVKASHVPVFDPKDSVPTNFDFFVHGDVVDDSVVERLAEKDRTWSREVLANAVRKSNWTVNTVNDRLASLPALKGKLRTLTSTAFYPEFQTQLPAKSREEGHQTKPTAVAETQGGQSRESVGELRDRIRDALRGVEVVHLHNKQSTVSALTALLAKYRLALDEQERLGALFSDPDSNLSFWTASINQALAAALPFMQDQSMGDFFKDATDQLTTLFQRLFFDDYLFLEEGVTLKLVQDALAEIQRLLGKDHSQSMLSSLCTEFLGFDNVVFVGSVDRFLDRLKPLKLNEATTQAELVARLSTHTAVPFCKVSDSELKHMLLDSTLLNSLDKGSLPLSDLPKGTALRLAVWMLANGFESINPKFRGTIFSLLSATIDHMPSQAQTDLESANDDLKQALVFTAKNGMLVRLDKVIGDFVKSAAKATQASPDKKDMRPVLTNLRTVLMDFVSENVFDCSPECSFPGEKIPDILFFALSNIKLIEDVPEPPAKPADPDPKQPPAQSSGQPPLAKKNSKTERGNSLSSQPAEAESPFSAFVNKTLNFMTARNIHDVSLVSIVTNFAINEQMNAAVLNGFIRFTMTQSNVDTRHTIIQDLCVRFAEVHKKLKSAKSKSAIRDFSSATVELLIELMRSYRDQLHDDPLLAHFAIQISLHVINEFESKVVANEPCKLPLRPHLVAPLFHQTISLLVAKFNFGGADNFQNFSEKDLGLFELVCNCVHMLVKGVVDTHVNLLHFFAQNFKSLRESTADCDLDTSLESLSIWSLCNYNASSPELKSFVGAMLKKLQLDIGAIYAEFFKKEEAAKLLLNFITANFKRLHSVLADKVEKQTLGFQAVYMSENAVDFLDMVLGHVKHNDILASHFLLHNRGLELVFEVLHRNSVKKGPVGGEAGDDSSLVNQLRKMVALGSESVAPLEIPKASVSPNKDKALFEEEFGAKIVHVHSDKAISNGSTTKDWSVNKAGKNSWVYNTLVPVNRKHVTLRFKANEDFELKTFRLALTIARSEQYMVVGPSPYVYLFAIQEDEKKEARRVFLGELKPVVDSGFLQHCAMVYVFNANRLDGRDFAKAIDSLKCFKELREFELVVARPLVSVVDRLSQLANRNLSAINLTVSFISIEGFSHRKFDIPGIFRNKVQTSFFNFLQLLFNSDKCSQPIDQFFDCLNRERKTGLFDIIERQLGNVMQNFDKGMTKFLMTLSEKNKRLADAIFGFLMKNLEDNASFFPMVERMLRKTMSEEYLLEFIGFGRRRLLASSATANQFLMVLTNHVVFVLAKLEREGKQPVFVLPVDEALFSAVLALQMTNPMTFQVERFLVMAVVMLLDGRLRALRTEKGTTEGAKVDPDSRQLGLTLLGKMVDKVVADELPSVHLLAFVAVHAAEARTAIVDNCLLDKVVANVARKDKLFDIESLLFIHSCCEVPRLFDLMAAHKTDAVLLQALEDHLAVPAFRDNNDLVSVLLQTIFSLSRQSHDKVDQLEQSLFAMLKRHKGDSFFIEKVLLRFFEFQMTTKASFDFRKEAVGEVADGLADEAGEGREAERKDALKVVSTNMPKEYLTHLSAQLSVLVDEKMAKSLKSFEWLKLAETNDSTEDFADKLKPKMFLRKPLLFVLSLDNAGTPGCLGMFVPEGFVKHSEPGEEVAFVPNTDNAFLFWYSEGTRVHYKPALDKCDKFLVFVESESQKGIVFNLEGSEKINLSMLADYQSSIDLYQMKPIPQDNCPDFEFPYDCAVNGVEVFQLDLQTDQKTEMASESGSDFLAGRYLDKMGQVGVVHSMLEDSVVFELPDQLSFRALKKAVPSLTVPDKWKDSLVGQSGETRVRLPVSKEGLVFSHWAIKDDYNPLFPVFEVFIQKGGVRYVIEKIKEDDSLGFLKEKGMSEVWRQVMDDLLDLQEIEGFLSAMTQSKDFLVVVFELFIGSGTSKRNWEEAEFAISSLVFEKLANILKNTDSVPMRFVFFRKNVLRKLLAKLRVLSYENVRTFVEGGLRETDQAVAVAQGEEDKDKDEPLLKEVKKRKGVGYEKEGSGKKWIVNEYLAKKKLRNEFIVSLLKLFKNLFKVDADEFSPDDPEVAAVKQSWFRTVAESCLLPLLEGAFKCSSLYEMSKEFELYEQYCEVLLCIGHNNYLRPLMLQLPPEYLPLQLESLASILKTQEANTTLFSTFAQNSSAKPVEGEEKLQSVELGNFLMTTIGQIKKLYPQEFADNDDDEYENITDKDVKAVLELPVNEMYKVAFKNLRFGLVDFKRPSDSSVEHHYASTIVSESKSSSQSRMVRLAQEIADLSSSLPIDSYNAITVRADANRLDVIKAMIAGAENTPYANGLFEYHVYLPSDYPTSPPKCNLETTGSGDVRFNPNLYACGKVCLSLLGTWRGTASENWDPKISNLLQLFLSIQSVVMSEEVYFNEPGYEGEAGTEEGEKKNEGYSNIVRLNNVKHAMIKQIKTPVVGFEDITRRHFYIKRHVVLKECGKWVKFGEARQCSYVGLVSDHNHKYASRFQANPKTYVAELKAAIVELERTLKELVDSSDPHTIFANKRFLAGKTKQARKKKAEGQLLKGETEKIDTAWDDFKQFEAFDADDKKVADRWSRYIGAMGIEAVKKQAAARVAVVGLNALGLEVAKNIVLSGVNTLTLVDWREVGPQDLLGNYYVSSADVGKNRAASVKHKLQQLNFYVKVEDKELSSDLDFVSGLTVLVLTDNYLPKTAPLLAKAAEHKVKVVVAETVGVFGRIFVDFGNEFVVNDRDGEDPSECYIKAVDHSTNTITLFEKSFNQLRDGDFIVLSEIESEEAVGEGGSGQTVHELNGSIHKIKCMRKVTEIEVEDLSKFKRYVRNGKVKELKVPTTHSFKRYADLTAANHQEFFDQGLAIHDFMKVDSLPLISTSFLLKESAERTSSKQLSELSLADVHAVMSDEQAKDEKLVQQVALLWATSKGSIHALCAFVGGVVSQQVIIGITGKYTPVKQLFCTDVVEVLSEDMKSQPGSYDSAKCQVVFDKAGKYGPLQLLVGQELMDRIRDCRIFMVGAGAIGCELLKNCSMLGIGSGPKGAITVTDPDSIELSNLNRQFLFREKHISKPKSVVASSVIASMNEDYKDHIVARLEKVCDDTEDIFNDDFIKSQSICLNALDNIKARIYMDQRCVKNSVALLESGTLGPKGHVQVILPHQTENYGQVQDAKEEHNIPVCTLKLFPEEPIHCMEWAKDRFEVLFAQNPQSLLRVLEEFVAKGDVGSVELKIQKKALKQLKDRPMSMADSARAARRFFQKSFTNKIKQLLHVYPLDFKNKEGKLFWTLPKRPPVALDFSLGNPVDRKFLESYSRLLSRIWGVEEKALGQEEANGVVGQMVFEEFKPKDSAIKKIQKDVEKMEKAAQGSGPKEQAEEEQDEDAEADLSQQDQLVTQQLTQLLKELDVVGLIKSVRSEVFEKDNDSNGHVDFIHSLTSLRSQNYKLAEMDWMSVKLKAGRIVPALATTTATIAALQAIEAVKIIKGNKLDEFKNCFLNLAIPCMTLSEPGPAVKHKITDSLSVTVWDQWTFDFKEKEGHLFVDFVSHFERTHGLFVVDVLKDNKPIFLAAINDRKLFEQVPLSDLLEIDSGESCYVSLICKLSAESEKPLSDLPIVKVNHK
jgi:ubiquitin-activating enzyme E1